MFRKFVSKITFSEYDSSLDSMFQIAVKIIRQTAIIAFLCPRRAFILRYIRRWNKTWFDHISDKQITYPFCVFAVGFVTFLRFGILWVSKCYPTGFSKMLKTGSVDSIQISVQEYFAATQLILIRPLKMGKSELVYIQCVRFERGDALAESVP